MRPRRAQTPTPTLPSTREETDALQLRVIPHAAVQPDPSRLEPDPPPITATTLAMLRPAAHPDAWHQVTAPGGYESWHFCARSIDDRTHILATLAEGFGFHPGYLRQFRRFLKRPTRVLPPRARDFPCIDFAVYRDGTLAGKFLTQFPAAAFAAANDVPRVTLGPNRMWLAEKGVYQLRVEGTVGATFAFRPKGSADDGGIDRRYLSRQVTGADHHWVPAAPRCEVTGAIRLPGGEPATFEGWGCHDHTYGTGPMGRGVKRWIRGRLLDPEAAISFHIVSPADARLPEEAYVLRSTPEGSRELAATPRVEGSKRCGWGLASPTAVDLGEALKLGNPRVIDSSVFSVRLLYEARSFGASAAPVLCEVIHPQRLRRPVLGRMIESQIDKRPIGDHEWKT